MAELGEYRRHELLLARDENALPIRCPAKFNSITEMVVTGAGKDPWPIPQNISFQQVARYIDNFFKTHWLWLEPDAVLLKGTGFDEIEDEYMKNPSIRFLGDLVQEPGIKIHCSGCAVYPGEVSKYADMIFSARGMAWDVWAADQIVPQMCHTNLIKHDFRHPKFESLAQVKQEISPQTAIFHSDKSGSLIDILRNQGTCDIFIKSFPKDYEWLSYCLRSIGKFCSGFRQVVLVVPKDGTRPFTDLRLHDKFLPLSAGDIPIHLLSRQEYGDGYMEQQVVKLSADTWSDADYILHLDSDTIFTLPVTPKTFMEGGKPRWIITDFTNATPDEKKAWMHVLAKWMGKPSQFEFMRTHPFMFPRWLYEKIRQFCFRTHGMTLDKYIMSQPGHEFSEFNCAGAYAYEFHRDKFSWFNTSENPPETWPKGTVSQKWSWGGLKPEIREEWEKILA